MKGGATRELDASLLVPVLIAVVRGGAISAEKVPRGAQGLTPGGSLAKFRHRSAGQCLGVGERPLALLVSLAVLVLVILGLLTLGLVKVEELGILGLKELVELRVRVLERLELLLMLLDLLAQQPVGFLDAGECVGVAVLRRTTFGIVVVLLLLRFLILIVGLALALGPFLLV